MASRESMARLETKAIALMRKAATDRLPVDAGLSGQLADVVRDAYVAGEQNMLAQVLAACRELTGDAGHEGHDDIDRFRDDLTDLMGAPSS